MARTTTDRGPDAGLLDLLGGRRAVLATDDGTIVATTGDVGVRPGQRAATIERPASPRLWSPCRLGSRTVTAWTVPVGDLHLVVIADPDAVIAPSPVTLVVFAPQPDVTEPLATVEPLPGDGAPPAALRPMTPTLLASVLDPRRRGGASTELAAWLPGAGTPAFVELGDVVVGVLRPGSQSDVARHPDDPDFRTLTSALEEGVALMAPVFDGDAVVALDVVYENPAQRTFTRRVELPFRMDDHTHFGRLITTAARAWADGETQRFVLDNRDEHHPTGLPVVLDVRVQRAGDLILAVTHDRSALVAAEAERVRAEGLLARSLNQMAEQTCACEPVFDADGRVVDARIVYANDASGSGMVGRSARESFLDPELFVEAAERAWRDDTTVRYAFTHAGDDGEDVTFEATVARCGSLVLSTLTDRSWEHRTRRALDESDRRYRLTAEALPLGVALLHVPGDPAEVEPEVLYVNPQMRSTIAVDDPMARPMSETFPLWHEYGVGLLRRAWASGGGVATIDVDNLDHALTHDLPSCSLHLVARCSGDRAVVVVADRTREALAARELTLAHQRLESVIASLDEMIVVLAEDGTVVLDNEPARRVLGVDRPVTLDDLRRPEVYDALGRRIPAGDGPVGRAVVRRQMADGVVVQAHIPGRGQRTWLRFTTRELDLQGGARGVLVIATDITDTLLVEERFRSTIDVLEEGVSLYEPVFDDAGQLTDVRHLYLNPAARAFMAQPPVPGQLRSDRPLRWRTPADVLRDVWRTGRARTVSIDNTGPDADPDLLVQRCDITYYRAGGFLVSVAVDRTPAAEAAARLAAADQRFAKTIEAIDEELAVFEPVLDGEGALADLRILYGNASWHAGRDDATPSDTGLLVSDYYVDGPAFLAVARAAWTTGERQTYVLENPDRAAYPQMRREHIEFSILRVGDELVSVGLDRSAEQKTLRRFRDLAAHDHETGLLSPSGLASRLGDLLEVGSTIGLVVIEVGQLEQVQRSYGFRTADDAVRELAARLREAVPTSPVARVGSSTFVAALPSVRRTTDVVAAANDLVALMQRPVDAGGVRLRLDASSGAVMAPLHGTDADTLIRRAKSAAWAALRSRLRCTVWSPQLEQQAPTQEVALLSDIDRGLANGEFFLDYQPKLDLSDLSLAGAEALVRWRHPTRGIVPPGAFIPLIEDSTLARPFTEHVIAEAVRAWRAEPALAGLRVAVNLPAVLVNDPALVESIADALVQAGAPASVLELEITERGLVAGDAVVRANLDELRNLGAHLAIDDFGTGAASLSYLRWLPVESVKIDRTFVRDLAQDPVNRSVVQACVTVARSLDLGVVAEGVETETEARVAAELGCGFAQGYLFGRPGPLAAVVAMAGRHPA